MIVPNGSLLPISGINIAFNREIIGLVMFSGLSRSASSKPLFSQYDTLEDVWCGLCCKIICDHLGYGVKAGLPYVWRKEVGDPMVSLQREFKGVDWLEQIVPFFQAIRLPCSALTVEDCFGEISRQVKVKLEIVDLVFAEVGSSMEDWIKAWKSVSS